jgi:hypothetical protein
MKSEIHKSIGTVEVLGKKVRSKTRGQLCDTIDVQRAGDDGNVGRSNQDDRPKRGRR